MWKLAGWVAVLLAGCGHKAPREAYAVGAYVGPSSLSSGSKCTYETEPASAAKLDDTKTIGTLVAPGKLKVICGGNTTEYDILAPTTAKIRRIDADTQDVKVGEKGMFRAIPYAGDRELTSGDHFRVEWTPGPDCAATATTEVDLPAGGDSLHGSFNIDVTGKTAGTCTLAAEVIGMKATQPVKIK